MPFRSRWLRRDARGWRPLADLAADARYAFRVVRRSPAFAIVAIVSLALGVGVNTLVFSVVNALVVRPLPIADPSRVVFVEPGRGFTLSYPDYRDMRDRTTAFGALVAYRAAPMDLAADRGPARVWGYLATGNYFDALGVTPAAGRFFHAPDDQHPGQSPVVVLSFDCWTARFGADPRAIGTTVDINGHPYTIIGVAPRGFYGTELFYRPELWVPMMMQAEIEPGNSWLDRRSTENLWVLGRLKPGVTPAQGAGDLTAIAARLAREYPSDQGTTIRLARPGLVGDALGGPVRAFTLALLVLAGLVLLAACTNLAAALSARAVDRRREMAIRLSIGAGRGRIMRQLLTETVLLAVVGGMAGLALAVGGARMLSNWQLPVTVPIQFDVRADPIVFAFALAASLGAGLLFGLLPARQASRTDAAPALKGADVAPGGARRRVRFGDVLVVLQVAICFVLVAACFVAVRGLKQTMAMPIGLEPDGVAMVGFDLGLAGYDATQGRAFHQRVLDTVSRLPGVISAAYANSVPLNIDVSTSTVYPDDQPGLEPAKAPQAITYWVSPGYFRTVGTRLIQGRSIDARDDGTAPRVAVVNETFARTVLRSARPVGRHFRFGSTGPSYEVVGVVEDGKYESLSERSQPVVFGSILQTYSPNVLLLARSRLPADRMIGAIRRAVSALDPRLPLYETETLGQMLGFVLLPSRTAAASLGAFGLLAAILAATGLYGVVSQAVARRSREIGIRMAIGAGPRSVLRVVLGRMAMLLAAGVTMGAGLAVLAAPVVASIVYESTPRDPAMLGAVAAGMMLVGLGSAWGPVRRALGLDPVETLRSA
jgi:predicted permease